MSRHTREGSDMAEVRRFYLRELGNSEVLAGAAFGKAILGNLIGQLSTAVSPEALVLDFKGVRVATGSFLRETVIALRDYCRATQPNLYSVVSNAEESIKEELALLLQDRNEVCVVCQLDDDGNFTNAELIGTLEEKQSMTLNAVLERGAADANELHRSYKHTDDISMTGWNNRLASLAAKGVLMEFKQGKGKLYKPVLEGLKYGR